MTNEKRWTFLTLKGLKKAIGDDKVIELAAGQLAVCFACGHLREFKNPEMLEY